MSRSSAPVWLRPVVDYGPVLLFVGSYYLYDMMTATVVIIVASLLVVPLAWGLERRLPVVPLITAGLLAVLGGMTLYLQDEDFIKIKPTFVYLLFAAILWGGLLRNKVFLKQLIGKSLAMTASGWRLLTFRFVWFFVGMAAANEVLRRALTTSLWMLWKFPGSVLVMLAFILLQRSLIQLHLDQGEP